MTGRWWLWLVLSGMAANVSADQVRVLVDGQRLAQLPTLSRFLLPDGSLLSYQDLVLACSNLQTSGVLHYRPDDGTCRPAWLLSPPDLPDRIDLTEGIQVFNRLTRETCAPGRCQVVVQGTSLAPGGGPAESPVTIDGFTASPVSLVGAGTTTLSWTTSNADACTLSDDQGTPTISVSTSGSADRTIDTTTLFTLACSNAVSSDTAATTVTVTVPPQAASGFAATDEDLPVTITLTGSDADGDPLTFTITTGPANGSLGTITPIDDSTAEVTYTPAPDFNGADSFTFRANDGTSDSTEATIDITVTAVNDPPTFVGGGDVIGLEDTSFDEAWAGSISPGPADESGQTVMFLVTGNSNPDLFAAGPAIDAAGTLTLMPAPDTFGSATLEVVAMDDGGVANDGNDLSAPVAFTIEVIAAADLVIDKTSGSFFTPAGGNVSYTLLITNRGPSDVAQATVIDIPPSRLGNATWTCTPIGPADCNPSGTTLIDELVNMPEGTSVVFQLQASLLDGDEDAITNIAEVQTPAGVLELAPASNVDSDTDLVGLFADGMESAEPD